MLQTPLLSLALALDGDFTYINLAFAVLEAPLVIGALYMRGRIRQARTTPLLVATPEALKVGLVVQSFMK